MANTNPQAIVFVNDAIRPYAVDALNLYFKAKEIILCWYGQEVNSKIVADTDPIMDGAASSGAPLSTGVLVYNVVTRALELVADMEANNNAKLNTLIALAQYGA